MIKIKIKKDSEKIKEVEIKGHALYDNYGKDIVCAAVSSIVITTVNAIETVSSDSIKCDLESFKITVLKDDEIVEKLLCNMINLLKELSLEYPKNIKFL